MDLMTVKKGLKSFDVCINQQAEQPVDIEFTLPDYCPKIEKIIKCSLTPRINSVSYSGTGVTAEGETEIAILYCAFDSGRLFGYETGVQFSKNIDAGTDCDRMIISCEARPEYVNCRAVNERKLDVHGAVTLNFTGMENTDMQVVTDSDDDKLQLLKQEIENVSLCGCASKQFIIEQELEIPQTLDNIENIIRKNADIHIHEVKIVANKAVIKGELSVNMMYDTAKGECETFDSSIPFEQMTDVDNCSENDIVTAEPTLCSFKIKTYTDSNGECRSVYISAKVNVDIKCMRAENMTMVSDCYSITNELSVAREQITLKCCPQPVSAVHQLRETLEFGSGALGKVIDVSCDVGKISERFEDGVMKINGLCTVFIIAADESGSIMCYDKNLPFDHEFNIDGDCDFDADVRADIESCSYSIKSSSELELRATINIGGFVFCKHNMQIITDITAADSEKPRADMPALILYYAKQGESIWDIAMRYNTAKDMIRDANSLEEDVLAEDKILMIPGI